MIARNERADRPIVASMSDLAASGGYYIAMPAQSIVAQPSTLTGSIGIFGGKFVTGGVYDKLGANIESTSIGRRAEMNSPVAALQRRRDSPRCEEQLQAFYDDFVEKVARVAPQHAGEDRPDGAGPRLDRPAGASRTAWSTSSAASIGRSRIAKEQAKIAADADVELVTFPPRKSFYELLSEEMSGVGQSAAIDAWMSERFSTGRAGTGARRARAVRDVPPRRSAGADAVYVRAIDAD